MLFSLVLVVMWFSFVLCHWFIVHYFQVCLVKSLVFVLYIERALMVSSFVHACLSHGRSQVFVYFAFLFFEHVFVK